MIQNQVTGFDVEGCDFIVGQFSLPLWGRNRRGRERDWRGEGEHE